MSNRTVCAGSLATFMRAVKVWLREGVLLWHVAHDLLLSNFHVSRLTQHTQCRPFRHIKIPTSIGAASRMDPEFSHFCCVASELVSNVMTKCSN